MDLISCKRCKRLFMSVHKHGICTQCEKEIELLFIKVKEFLYENPQSTMSTISLETGVSTSLITRFIREGRLTLSKDSPIKRTCSKCGAPIISGKLCNKCHQKIVNNIEDLSKAYASETLNSKASDTGNKMRFLGK